MDYINRILKLYDREILSHQDAFNQLLDGAVNKEFGVDDIPANRTEFDFAYIREVLNTEPVPA